VLRTVVARENRAVILISHKLDEVMHATDRVTIMRDGAVVARLTTAETDAEELAREMIGRVVSLRSVASAVGHLEVLEGTTTRPATAAVAAHEPPVALSLRDVTVIEPTAGRASTG